LAGGSFSGRRHGSFDFNQIRRQEA
jgi:hypothetical protein